MPRAPSGWCPICFSAFICFTCLVNGLDCLRSTTGGGMVRACVVFGIGAVAGALLIDCLIPGGVGGYPVADALAILTNAQQQGAFMLSPQQGMKYPALIA